MQITVTFTVTDADIDKAQSSTGLVEWLHGIEQRAIAASAMDGWG